MGKEVWGGRCGEEGVGGRDVSGEGCEWGGM